MYANQNVPEAWQIAELERLRRIRESEWGERASIPLPLPPPPPAAPRESNEKRPASTVVVIDLW